MSPSPSRSAMTTSRCPGGSAMTYVSHIGGLPPSLLYQTTLPSVVLSISASEDPLTTSRIPSPSRSPAATDRADGNSSLMTYFVNPPSPSFIYQTTVSPPSAADRTSRSPSSSMSAAVTKKAKGASSVIIFFSNVGGDPPSLLYHPTVLSPREDDMGSATPSPSRSPAKTLQAPSVSGGSLITVRSPKSSFLHVLYSGFQSFPAAARARFTISSNLVSIFLRSLARSLAFFPAFYFSSSLEQAERNRGTLFKSSLRTSQTCR
mmetsp:Transcript_15416/g.50422  ORF Transcript_15416/g.50422 Transcript_15416/m.50422 type:complete len:262 (-) Transcript_15416:1256-2041(-)